MEMADRADLCEIVGAAREAWPDFGLRDEAFAQYVAARTKDGEAPCRDRAPDLYLACACASGVAAALRAFDPILRAAVASAVARIDGSAAFRDLVAQEVRTRLLVGSPPKIAEYAGHAPLARWLKTVAARTALNLKRGKAQQVHESVRSTTWTVAAGPDAALFRARFREEFRQALAATLGRMPPRDRAILSLNVRDGMSIDKIATAYGVGRSTAARWLAAARETLEKETRAEIVTRLNLTPSQFRSVAAAVRSDIDVSLAGLLEAER